MEPNAENSCRRDAIKEKLRQNFDGKIVRKDLTKKIKEGANVPVYVLEFLLGQYCSSDDEAIIEKGVQNVKHILADNFVRPDEAQKDSFAAAEKGQPHHYRYGDRASGHQERLLLCRVFQPGALQCAHYG